MHVRKDITAFKPGYLLLEVTLAILISALILGTVFKIAEWNLNVSNDAVENSNTHMKHAAFFSFLDRAFQELSGDALIELNTTETSSHFLSEMIIQNAGEVFSWPNQPFTPRAVKIVTRLNGDKTIDILLEYYQDYLIKDPKNPELHDEVETDQEPLQTLILLDDIWRFEWRVWNGVNTDGAGEPSWVYDWTDTITPRYLELNAVFSPEEKPAIHTFWNPQKINPDQHFKQFLRQNPQQPITPVDPNRPLIQRQ